MTKQGQELSTTCREGISVSVGEFLVVPLENSLLGSINKC